MEIEKKRVISRYHTGQNLTFKQICGPRGLGNLTMAFKIVNQSKGGWKDAIEGK